MFYSRSARKFLLRRLITITTALFVSLVFFFSGFGNATVVAQELVDPLNLDVGSAILIDAESGQVLYERNVDEMLPPASMSKMMTEYLVLDAIKAGKISWDDVVTTGENASSVIGSRIFLAKNDKHTVEELYIAMAIYSANDATVSLAEFIGGSEENFARLMNEKAQSIGIGDIAHFINATGLNRVDMKSDFRPTTIDGETVMSARALAILAANMLKDHPDLVNYSSITSHQFRERDAQPMINLNRMLEGWEQENNLFSKYAYEGLDGLKTGYTNEAGYCFTGTAKRGNMRLVTVVMNTSKSDINKRFDDTRKLMDYGFNHFEKKTVLSPKMELEQLPLVEIKKGVQTEVRLVTEHGIDMIVTKGEAETAITVEAQALEDKLEAPISKGDALGTVTVKYDLMGTVVEKSVNLIATEDVGKAGWLQLLFRAIGNFFHNIWSGILNLF